jgi:hybrid cluster-associated redox disulfide protein
MGIIKARRCCFLAITKKMSISEVVSKHPQTVSVFMEHGMSCLGCAAARFENIEQGALAHGIDVEKLLTDLNKTIDGQNK